ncbi:MAG: pilus assembly protein TadG-related protein [Bacteriovoracia bacterium]
MAKRNPMLALTQNEQGQISIFFSASLVVMITIVAFVINVGLFVKAKVNLQNATDAAAYAGASVQARQLSKIAYLNWEMRNVYKEWMYKYYVIGNLNIEDVENPGSDGTMSFTLKEDRNVLSGVVTKDQFNIPTVCIHIAGSQTNICKRYSVPGLPEFGSSNLPGAEEASRAFMDTLISTKINDCIDRTRLNMAVANTWTYNVLGNSMDESIAGRGPAILADRQGAWPRAVELAMRIRNLEYVMNRPAITTGVCNGGSTDLTSCKTSISEIIQERKLGNERTIKAFYTGYRNLGNLDDNEMKNSFTLTEIPPEKVFSDNDADASNLLLPSNDPKFREKQWVDLKLMMVNYAIFYAALIPRADDKTSGACDISKVAIPVPGYPMGFYKNPDVLTYYAVRGEAEFIGMFNPFKNPAVKMTAYAAAKPFGGRIGPMLFVQNPNQNFLVGRTDNNKFRSLPYITSYNFKGAAIRGEVYDEDTVKFIPGLPLPTNSNQDPGPFWLTDPSQPLGGRVTDAAGVQFGVPNLVYDYEVPHRITNYSSSTARIHTINSGTSSGDAKIGLFSKYQFSAFKGTALNNNITPETLDEEIARVRAPTSYDAANYLVPTPFDFNLGNGLDSFGFISGEGDPLSNGVKRYTAYVYAPLYKANDQTDVIYEDEEIVKTAIFDFMRAQRSGITKYRMALNRAALNIWERRSKITSGAQGSVPGYERAAKGVSDIDLNNPDIKQIPQSCNSIAGQFLHFYYGGEIEPGDAPSGGSCDPKATLGNLIREYFSRSTTDVGYDPTYYRLDFSWKGDLPPQDNMKMLSAYMPGPFTGAQDDGTLTVPISGGPPADLMRRNTYSTKFVTLDSLQTNGFENYANKQFQIYTEGDPGATTPDTSQKVFRNPLNPTEVNADLTSIKY